MAQNRWVIPDIHGYSETLSSLLDQIRPNKKDHLIFLGDFVDRGPDSKGVLDQIMAMQEKGYRITALMGNHEAFMLDFFIEAKKNTGIIKSKTFYSLKNDWLEFGGKTTLKSFGVKRISQIPYKYFNWIQSLKYYFSFSDYVLVHAGLNFKEEDVFSDKKSMLWAKEFKVIPSKIGFKQLVHGHTPVDLEYIHHCINQQDHEFIDLDNGVYMTHKPGFGNLLALELNNKTLITQHNVD